MEGWAGPLALEGKHWRRQTGEAGPGGPHGGHTPSLSGRQAGQKSEEGRRLAHPLPKAGRWGRVGHPSAFLVVVVGLWKRKAQGEGLAGATSLPSPREHTALA